MEILDSTITDTEIELTERELKILKIKKEMEMLENRYKRAKTLQRLIYLLDNPDGCYNAKEALFLRGMLTFKDIVDDRITHAEATAAWERYITNPNKDDDSIVTSGILIQQSKIEGMRVVLGKPFTHWEESFDTALSEERLLTLEEQLVLLENPDTADEVIG